MFIYIKSIIILFIIVFINSCSNPLNYFDEEEEVLSGKRLDVLTYKEELVVSSNATRIPVEIELMAKNDSWNQRGRLSTHSSGNLFLSEKLQPIWESSVGYGDDEYNKLYSNIVAESGRVFSLDSEGNVFCTNVNNGEYLWKKNILPSSESINSNIDGGIAIFNGVLVTATSYGEVIALKAEDGSILWKNKIGMPAQGSPTISDNKVFQMTVDNNLIVIDLLKGTELWRYSGAYESAILNGASSVAVGENIAIFPSNNGELIAFNKNIGSILWSVELSLAGGISLSKDLNDIDSGPVIEKNLVFAGTVEGRFGSVDYQTGLLVWDVPLKTTQDPVVNGDSVFVLSEKSNLFNLRLETGEARWITDLKNMFNTSEDSSWLGNSDESDDICKGPVLAGNQLWVGCKDGLILGINPYDGSAKKIYKLSSKHAFSPIVINGTLLFYTKDAKIFAFR